MAYFFEIDGLVLGGMQSGVLEALVLEVLVQSGCVFFNFDCQDTCSLGRWRSCCLGLWQGCGRMFARSTGLGCRRRRCFRGW